MPKSRPKQSEPTRQNSAGIPAGWARQDNGPPPDAETEIPANQWDFLFYISLFQV